MNDFIDQLASAAPTPGGGGASACVGALASALASMVGNLTVGKKTYARTWKHDVLLPRSTVWRRSARGCLRWWTRTPGHSSR